MQTLIVSTLFVVLYIFIVYGITRLWHERVPSEEPYEWDDRVWEDEE